jgi:hypothetical protein
MLAATAWPKSGSEMSISTAHPLPTDDAYSNVRPCFPCFEIVRRWVERVPISEIPPAPRRRVEAWFIPARDDGDDLVSVVDKTVAVLPHQILIFIIRRGQGMRSY